MAVDLSKILPSQADAIEADRKAKEAKQAARAEALETVKAIIDFHAFTQNDLFPSKGSKAKSATAASNTYKTYKNPTTGETWTMKGPARKPEWVLKDGKPNEDLLLS